MNFDAIELAQLRQRNGNKWRVYPDDVIPAWVADMDLPVAEPIHRAIQRQLQLNDLGYCAKPPEDPVAGIFAERMLARFGWRPNPEWIEGLVDIVQGIYIALHVYSKPGDGVIVFTPSYPPIMHAVAQTGRRLVSHQLHFGAGGFAIDFTRLEQQIDQNTKILLLCSPHNPTGRVWSRDELTAMAQLAERHDLIVISDEIHADIVFTEKQHIPFASLSPQIEQRTVTFNSATKAFNIAGLRFALAIFGSEQLLNQFNTMPRQFRGGVNSAGLAATKAAWQESQTWLDQALSYLQANRDFLGQFLRSRLPDIRYAAPEATFLAWLDCKALALPEQPFPFFLQQAKVAFSDGNTFGDGGRDCVRLNFATSRSILNEILERVASAL